jgi:SPP1 family predicted phage head-tail adaptor
MIGKLDERIILQSLSETNNRGSLSQAWATVATVWAYIIQPKGNEAFESARLNASETIRVKMRWRDDVTVKWRLQWRGQNYSITHVDRSEYKQGWLWLMASAKGVA